jgi:hypothetical protein
VVSVQRLTAHVLLDDSSAALAHAKAEAEAGDEPWTQWLTEYERGEALAVRLELTLKVANGEEETLNASTPGFFIERDLHAPKVEQQIAEVAAGDFAELANELAARGYDIGVYELSEMYVHVELDPELRSRLERVAAE